MSDRHVRPVDDGWTVVKADAARASAHSAVQAEAITRAVEIVAKDGGGRVVVHALDDSVRESRDVPANTTDTGRIATELAAASTASGVATTTYAVGQEVGRTADEVAGEASTAAKKVAGHTRTTADHVRSTAEAAADDVTDEAARALSGDKSARAAAEDAATAAVNAGGQILDQADSNARQVRGETRAAAQRTAALLDDRAQEAEEQVAEATERAAKVGQRADHELHSLADRTDHAIRRATESVAAPLDRLAAVFNPIRITGRVVEAVAVGGLRLTGRATARGTDAARRGARDLANR